MKITSGHQLHGVSVAMNKKTFQNLFVLLILPPNHQQLSTTTLKIDFNFNLNE
jgi:hypothetical protein